MKTGLSRVNLAEIDALMDTVERARLHLALQDAVRVPSPANLALLKNWPSEWVVEAQQLYGVPRDRRLVERTEREANAETSRWGFWEWVCWKWFALWNRRAVL